FSLDTASATNKISLFIIASLIILEQRPCLPPT
ncbi:MAG: hypothetical protein ACJAUL_003322, partial [Paraglaciecola sp.]